MLNLVEFWKYFVDKYKNEIIEKGITEPLSFRDEFKIFSPDINPPRPELHINLDFKTKQNKYLKEKGYFVIRVGDGKFCLIDEKKYDDCYLDLPTDNLEKLIAKPINSNPFLENLFLSKNTNEKTIIPIMKHYDILSKIIKKLGLGPNYYDGPLVRNKLKFSAYLNNKNSTQYEEIDINSQVESDYTIYCDKKLILIELKTGSNLESMTKLGWHKLIYPSMHFYESHKERQVLDIIPMYVFQNINQNVNDLYIYAFEKFAFHSNGIELNRKVLADLAMNHPEAFKAIVDKVK